MNEEKLILPESANNAPCTHYIAPQIQVLNVNVEHGFSGSAKFSGTVSGWGDGNDDGQDVSAF